MLKLSTLGYAAVVFVTLITSASPTLASTLLGDMLTFVRAYPDVNTPYLGSSPGPSTVTTTVTADNSDEVTLQSPFWEIDPGATNIVIDVQGTSTMIGSASEFDGIVITGFSHAVVNATVLVTDPGNQFSAFELIFDASSIALSLVGPFNGDETIDISVTVSAVPLPAALPLFGTGLGLMGLFGCWRRHRAAEAV